MRDWISRLTKGVRRGGEGRPRPSSGPAPGGEGEVVDSAGAEGVDSTRGGGVDGDEEGEGGAAVDPFDPFPEPVRLEIEDVFDLHTIAPRDVKRAVEAYLLEARRAGFASVRLIHGKGRGVQRETVRAVLARTDFVLSFTDAPPSAGGIGATVAHLRGDEG